MNGSPLTEKIKSQRHSSSSRVFLQEQHTHNLRARLNGALLLVQGTWEAEWEDQVRPGVPPDCLLSAGIITMHRLKKCFK
jgi:hypothetical protein